jgi:uncharacterized protein HemY
MNTPVSFRRTAAAAVVLAFALPLAAPAWAQQDYGVGSTSLRAKRDAARKAAQAEKGEDTTTPPLYPQATREQPEAKASRPGLKRLQKLQEDYQKQDDAAVLKLAAEIAGDAESNAYEKSFAYQLAGTAASNQDDQAAAADYFAKAVEVNGLPNNDHYTAMFNLAAIQYGLDRFPDALATIDRFLAETKSEKPEALALKGGVLMNMERYDDAAALYTSLLAAKPDDKTLRMNAVSAYQQADKPEKAVALLAEAQAKGQLTTKDEYRALYVSYINADRDKEAIKVVEDGVAKGILQPSPELAKDYMVLGQKAYYADDTATAIEMYQKAAPMAADGEAALNLARLYAEAGRDAEAKAAAQQALDKGVKDTAGAKKIVGGK